MGDKATHEPGGVVFRVVDRGRHHDLAWCRCYKTVSGVPLTHDVHP